jgi:hypothetical protein
VDFEADEDLIEDDEWLTPQQIARRSIILTALISVIYGKNLSEIVTWLKKEDLWDELTPNELEFVSDPANERAQINLSWKSEALVALLWSINKFHNIPKLDNSIDIDDLNRFSVQCPSPTYEYISTAELRSEEEIGVEYEVVCDAHWSVRDAQINNKPIPNNLDSGVVMERHFGFNYVIGYCALPWDEITTDT